MAKHHLLLMQIRLYQPRDLDQTVALWWHTRQTAFTYIKEQHTFSEYISFFRDVVTNKNQVWLAELSNQIGGFIAIKQSHVDHLYVAPNHQRQGVGTALLNKAKELSPQGLSLYTLQKNSAARTFYEKHGFKAFRFGLSPDEGEPDVRYEWSQDDSANASQSL